MACPCPCLGWKPFFRDSFRHNPTCRALDCSRRHSLKIFRQWLRRTAEYGCSLQYSLFLKIFRDFLQDLFKLTAKNRHGAGEHAVDGIVKVLGIAAALIAEFMRFAEVWYAVDHFAVVVHIAVELLAKNVAEAALKSGIRVRLPTMEIVEVGQHNITLLDMEPVILKNLVCLRIAVRTRIWNCTVQRCQRVESILRTESLHCRILRSSVRIPAFGSR